MESAKTKSWRRRIVAAVVVALLFIGIFLKIYLPVEKASPKAVFSEPILNVQAARGLASVAEGHGSAAPLSAAEQSLLAQKKLRNAFMKLITARTYRVVMKNRMPAGGWVTVTYLRGSSPAGEILFRMDILNFEASGAVVPYNNATDIHNQAGNWEMGDFPGSEDVAFHVTSSSNENQGKMMYDSYVAKAHRLLDTDNTYTEASGVYGTRAVDIISAGPAGAPIEKASELYALDAASGELVYSSANGEYVTTYETNPPVPAESFNVPSGKIVAETQDPVHARNYLYSAPTPTTVAPEKPSQ